MPDGAPVELLNHAVKLPVKFCRVIPADMDVGQLMQKHELRVFLVSKHSPNFLLLPFTTLYSPLLPFTTRHTSTVGYTELNAPGINLPEA